ncbi:hypothetical protein H4Q26_008755 [Puccinia striiformis f. sp. tritici PST-130]|nr:hypothetical protein H4Q26_008755 [Puccinia striiformis f. sp. tritici PST-130]
MNEQEEQSKLVQLIGNNVPSIPLEILKTNTNNRSKHCPQPRHPIGSQPRSKTQPERMDETQTLDGSKVYRFARYNTTSNVFSYTTEEYYHLLRDDHWTKAETDYLFDLLNTYDLRFPVVHDRYEFGGSHERSLDDLKARYYSICQNLIPHRPNLSTHHQIRAELTKKLKNRDELMKVIGGFQHHFLNEMKFWPIVEPSPTTLQLSRQAIINSHLNSANNLLLAQQQTESGSRVATNPVDKRHLTTTDDVPNDEEMMSMGYPSRGIDPQIALANDKKHCIHRSDSQPIQTGHCRTVGLRSTRITLPKTVAASTRISSVLSEMQIPNLLAYLPKPLIMPTRQNVESYERLILATNQLIDLRRIADRVDNDLKAHRKKKDSLLVSLINPSSSSSVDLIQPSTEIDNPPPLPPRIQTFNRI